MPTPYTVGDTTTLSLLVAHPASGAAYGPTTVTLTVQDPGGTQTTPALSNPAVGSYTASVALSLAGAYSYKWTATGGSLSLSGAAQGQVQVAAPLF